MNLNREIIFAVNADIIVDEIAFRYLLHVGGNDLWIVGDNRTVIIVVGVFLPHVVGHARIENGRNLLVKQGLNCGMDKLGWEADRIGRNRILRLLIFFQRSKPGGHDLKAQFSEEGVPERKQFHHVQRQRQADFAA